MDCQVQEAVNKAKDRDETRASDLIGHEERARDERFVSPT